MQPVKLFIWLTLWRCCLYAGGRKGIDLRDIPQIFPVSVSVTVTRGSYSNQTAGEARNIERLLEARVDLFKVIDYEQSVFKELAESNCHWS